jgi:hypothetical protein
MASRFKLTGTMSKIDEISPDQITGMFRLMCNYYENLSPDRFRLDLEEKDRVLLLRDENGEVRGFTTIKTYDFATDGIAVKLVFSGDTIVHHECWGDRELHRSWIRNVYDLAGVAERKTYWLLISKGYKTYRFLPVYFYRFYPSYEREIPGFERKVRDGFCREQYPDFYDSERGVLHFNGTRDYLKPGVADITPERLRDPHINYFVTQNPGHARGDELVCLAQLNADNIKPLGLRYLGMGSSR